MRTTRVSFVLAAAGILGGGMLRPAMAQNTAVPNEDGRFYIELKDAPLSDALEMIFKAAGNPSHIIDPATRAWSIAPIVFNNVSWHAAVRQLANQNDCRFFKNPSGTYVVEPRPQAVQNTEGGPGMPGLPGMRPGMPAVPGMPGRPGLPSNAFGGGNNRRRPAVSTRANPQVRPAAGAAVTVEEDTGDKIYRLISVDHVYVGGMARLFSNADLIDSISFLVPEGAMNSMSGGGGFGQGGGGFGGGGFGQSGGGFGQSGGGFGGGGFGGGGFGGGGFGGGGFGTQSIGGQTGTSRNF